MRRTGRSFGRLASPLCAALATALVLLATPIERSAIAAGGDPLPEPTPSPGSHSRVSPESTYNRGLALAKKQQWAAAEKTYREAIAMRNDFPEAWNGLGHALKQQRRFDEAVAAYDEALRLRPDYAQALEYLGETYLAMGKLKEANDTLAHLRRVDEALADQLSRAIMGKTRRASSW
jgi:tetratricopeptide (TPR) repeat protein